MPSVGNHDKAFVSSIALMDAREIYPKIINQSRDNHFVSLVKLFGRFEKTDLSVYHNHVNEDVNLVGVINGAGTGSGTTSGTFPLTAASSGAWVKGHQIRVNGKSAVIVSVSTNTGTGVDTITWKSTANITFTTNDKVYWQSAAVGQGAKAGKGVRYKTTPYSNKIQIIEIYGATITDIQSMNKVEIEGDGIWGYQREQEMILVKKAISGALLAGQGSTTLFSDGSPSLVDAEGNPIQMTSGLDEQVTTYGGSRAVDVSGVVDLDDIYAREDLMLSRKAPKTYMAIGSTAAMRPYSTFLKNLGSAGVNSVRMQIDGKEVDLTVDAFNSVGGFRYEFVPIETLNDPAMFPVAVGEIAANLYYIPKDDVELVGGGTAKRFCVRYQENKYVPKSSGPNVRWQDLIREQLSGGLAPNPVGDENIMTSKWTAYMGAEFLGLRHFFKETMIK